VGERVDEAVEAAGEQRVDEQQMGDRRHLGRVADPARHRQQLELHREQHDQEDAEPEARHGHAEQRAHGGHPIEDRVLLTAARTPERDRREQRDQEGDEG
jgi:hypothetical protein